MAQNYLWYLSAQSNFKLLVPSRFIITSLPPAPFLDKATHITFVRRFNAPIASLPPALRHLQLSEKFNHPLPALPLTLVELNIGTDFNHPLPPLPATLKSLQLSNRFNQPLPSLPPHLVNLQLGEDFNHPLPSPLPPLRCLQLRQKFTQPVSIPSTLNILIAAQHIKEPVSLHSSLTLLMLDDPFNLPIPSLPLGLRVIMFGTSYNQRLPPLASLTNLQILVLGEQYSHLIDSLPPSVTILNFPKYQQYLPPSFHHLITPERDVDIAILNALKGTLDKGKHSLLLTLPFLSFNASFSNQRTLKSLSKEREKERNWSCIQSSKCYCKLVNSIYNFFVLFVYLLNCNNNTLINNTNVERPRPTVKLLLPLSPLPSPLSPRHTPLYTLPSRPSALSLPPSPFSLLPSPLLSSLSQSLLNTFLFLLLVSISFLFL